MSNVQLSLFGNVKISEILSEIQAIHKAFWYLRKDEEDKDYQVCRYSDGDILLCVYRKKQADKETREKILAKAVYDKPKYLNEITPFCKYKGERCECCLHYVETFGGCCKTLKRPPQNYMFIDEL